MAYVNLLDINKNKNSFIISVERRKLFEYISFFKGRPERKPMAFEICYDSTRVIQ